MKPPLMRGAPPQPDQQVTLANWRQAPFSQWGFRNVRSLVPTAAAQGAAGTEITPLREAWQDLGALEMIDAAGARMACQRYLRASNVDGLVVLRRGELAFEFYDNGLEVGQQHILFSVSKSVTGALAGVLVERGLLDPDRPVTEYLPELHGSFFAGASVRNLLDMTVSTAFSEDYAAPVGDMPAYRRAAGWDPGGVVGSANLRGFLAGLKGSGAGAHGEAFHYVSPDTDTLGWVLERAGGLPFARMLSEWVWRPMGAEREAWVTLDSFGAPRTAGGVCMTTRDLARFGEMMRRGGVANGRQIIPAWWVDDLRTNGDRGAWERGNFAAMGFPACRYRSKWYLYDEETGAFGGAGIHGQWLYVCPTNEVVIAAFGSQADAADVPGSVAWIANCGRIARELGSS